MVLGRRHRRVDIVDGSRGVGSVSCVVVTGGCHPGWVTEMGGVYRPKVALTHGAIFGVQFLSHDRICMQLPVVGGGAWVCRGAVCGWGVWRWGALRAVRRARAGPRGVIAGRPRWRAGLGCNSRRPSIEVVASARGYSSLARPAVVLVV